uniref:Putative secreted protein n=1 Tax=Nyssomyia neivai TaxID=330878 RepID=A0A1L8DNJ8_9DIPT
MRFLHLLFFVTLAISLCYVNAQESEEDDEDSSEENVEKLPTVEGLIAVLIITGADKFIPIVVAIVRDLAFLLKLLI